MKTIIYIGNALSAKGNTTTVLETLSEQLREEGFEVIIASSKKAKALRLLDMCNTVIKHRKAADAVLIDTYSTQNFYYATTVGRLCRKFKIPYFPILHGGNLPQRLEQSPLQSRKYFGGAKLNIAPSHYLMEAFKNKGFNEIIHIPNSIEIENYPFKVRKAVAPKLLWVRSFSEIYNPEMALLVLESLIQNSHQATLTMVGPEKDGSLAKCKAIAQAKALPATFTGLLSKKSWIELSAKHEIFINTTNFDNLPVSVIEAMALGLPVVSTNVGGLPYMINNGVDGFLVPPNDVKAMVNAIEKICNDQLLSTAMSKAARIKGESYNWSNIKESWNEVLDF